MVGAFSCLVLNAVCELAFAGLISVESRFRRRLAYGNGRMACISFEERQFDTILRRMGGLDWIWLFPRLEWKASQCSLQNDSIIFKFLGFIILFTATLHRKETPL